MSWSSYWALTRTLYVYSAFCMHMWRLWLTSKPTELQRLRAFPRNWRYSQKQALITQITSQLINLPSSSDFCLSGMKEDPLWKSGNMSFQEKDISFVWGHWWRLFCFRLAVGAFVPSKRLQITNSSISKQRNLATMAYVIQAWLLSSGWIQLN